MTIKALGYPSKSTFKRWLNEAFPNRKKYCISGGAMVEFPREKKEQAVIDLCARTGSAKEVADAHGVNPVTLYEWKKQLLGGGKSTAMPRNTSHTKGKNESKTKDALCSELTSLRQEVAEQEQLLQELKRDFHAEQPNEKWLTDITEFSIPAGKVYLSPIIDCFDGLAVTWTIGVSPSSELVNSMLDAAIAELSDSERPIIHSDRGGHYRWPGWIERMDSAGLIRSMSKKGCSPDNSACEGFFGRLKNEMFYNRSWRGVTIEEFINRLDTYLHWYNEDRIKESLNWMSPLEYRRSLGLCK